MICSFKRMIYPKNVASAQSGEYTIALYTLHEKLLDAQNNLVREAKVVGHYLPVAPNVRVDMSGEWRRNAKHGVQFAMSGYKEVVQPTRQGIEAYLASGLIKGIGPEIAARIYDAFGADTLRVLDEDPHALLKVKGISQAKLKRICDSFIKTRGARDTIALLAPFGVTPNRAVSIYKHFGKDAASIVRRHPYTLCDMHGIGFQTADKIAASMGLDRASSERIAAGLLYTLKNAESNGGHLCLPKRVLIAQCAELLNTPEILPETSPEISQKRIAEEALELLNTGKLELYGDQVYRSATAHAEKRLAARICKQLAFGAIAYKGDLDADIDAEQKRMGVQLAPEQRAAVKLCLTSHVSIITGGPGTGKTLIQRAILGIYAKHNPNAKIVCCAPTGRAARRMSQCTGYPASTVHKALKLFAGDDGEFGEPDALDADLVLADEVSMLDVFLAEHLLSAVPSGSQLVLIGDSDQLPSVGPGAVLSELIACGKIPVVKLDRVYRQDAGSRIAMNAKLIRHNNVALEYGEDFALLESSDMEHSALVIELIYLEEVARLGIDNVALLTPFRRKTATGVDALNERLREKVNPPSHLKPEAAFGRKTFRQGDKVMWTKNLNEINNGDIGYITAVTRREDGMSACVDFGDGRVAKLDASKLDYLELAYATTVHKSQGSEYATVILSLQTAHYIMLKRPLLYTAITRAKERAIIVGERKALCAAISTADAQKRGTLLARRISELCGSDA